jgi:hypothetical protein
MKAATHKNFRNSKAAGLLAPLFFGALSLTEAITARTFRSGQKINHHAT